MGAARRRAAAAGIAVAAIVGPIAAGQAADGDRPGDVLQEETAQDDVVQEDTDQEQAVQEDVAPEGAAQEDTAQDAAPQDEAPQDIAVPGEVVPDDAGDAIPDDDAEAAEGEGERRGPPPGRPRGHGYGLADRPADDRGLARGHAKWRGNADRPGQAGPQDLERGPGNDHPGHSHGRGKPPGHTHGNGHAVGHTHGPDDADTDESDGPTDDGAGAAEE